MAVSMLSCAQRCVHAIPTTPLICSFLGFPHKTLPLIWGRADPPIMKHVKAAIQNVTCGSHVFKSRRWVGGPAPPAHSIAATHPEYHLNSGRPAIICSRQCSLNGLAASQDLYFRSVVLETVRLLKSQPGSLSSGSRPTAQHASAVPVVDKMRQPCTNGRGMHAAVTCSSIDQESCCVQQDEAHLASFRKVSCVADCSLNLA